MTEFSEILREKFLSGQSNQFILYDNVYDYYNLDGSYYNLIEYLNNFLKKSQRLQIQYNIAKGINFLDEADLTVVRNAYKECALLGGSSQGREAWFDKALNDSSIYPQVAIKFIEECLKLSNSPKDGKSIQFSVIIDHAETIIPASANSQMSDTDRQKLVIITEWLTSQSFTSSLHLVIFISNTLAALNEKVIYLPSITPVQIPRPDFEERLNFIKHQFHAHKQIKSQVSQTQLAQFTAGITLKGIEHLFLSSDYKREKLNQKAVIKKTNEILVKELGDIVEIFTPAHTMKAVIGLQALKNILSEQMHLIKNGDSLNCPVGILVSGPNGAGKTFIFEAFAREIDFNIIKFKKIRSQWYGQTDIIFEKIKSVLTSIGKVVVLIDEADTAFGGRSDTTHETEKRLFGNIIQMMGNPQNRGKIIWILITSRPDMLEPDIKRSGRAGLHLPVFDPQGEDRLTFIKGILKEINININNFEKAHLQEFLDYTAVYSLADFNELKILLKTKSEVNKRNLKCDEIIEIAKDFNPSNISKERRYQTLVAASECTFKSLLPPDLRDMERVFIEKELLRQELGY